MMPMTVTVSESGFTGFHFLQDISLVDFKCRYLALTDHKIPLSTHVLCETQHDCHYVVEKVYYIPISDELGFFSVYYFLNFVTVTNITSDNTVSDDDIVLECLPKLLFSNTSRSLISLSLPFNMFSKQ